MRPTITWLLVLLIGSMLVGTAFAECAAMAMPCCSQHSDKNCHEICAAPTGNLNAATVPGFTGDLQAVSIITPVVALPPAIAAHIQSVFTPSSENLLRRIHVLLI